MLWRCLPLLRGVRRHLVAFGVALAVLLGGLLPLGAIAADVFWTGVLQGEPLSATHARLLALDPATSVEVETLAPEVRRAARDRLFLAVAGVVLGLALPAAGGLVYYYLWITQRLQHELRLRLHDRLQTLSLRFHAQHSIGDALYRLHQDSAMVSDLLEALFLTPLLHAGRHALAAAALALLSPAAALAFLAAWPPALALGAWVSRPLRVRFRAARESNAALAARIQEVLAGIQVVKAFGAEPALQARFEDDSRVAFAAAFRARWLVAVFSVAVFAAVCGGVLAATGVGADAARRGAAVAAAGWLAGFGFAGWTLGLFNFAKGELGWGALSFRVLYRMWARLQDMAIGLDRTFEILDLEPEVRDAPDARELAGVREGIAFRGVGFAWSPGRPVLAEVSFEARAGTLVALVGPSGAGKSTLLALLLRLFDPDAGAIEIDGTDLRALQLESLRAGVAVVLQESLLFGTTVRENIRYALPQASDAAVQEAARIACADEFIRALPRGYDTVLGERGSKLSAGQRQRLALARALLKDAPVLVLDEPTAALDPETELRVLASLAEWGRGRVIFLVTHRVSAIRRADQILVLHEGRLVERGSHEELAGRPDGLYRAFAALDALSAPERALAP